MKLGKSAFFFSNQIKNQLLQDRFESPILKPLLFNKIISLRFINIGLITLSIELLNKKNFLKLPDTPNQKHNKLHQTPPIHTSFFWICYYKASALYYLSPLCKTVFCVWTWYKQAESFLQTSEASAYWKKSLTNNKFFRFPYTQSFLS